MGRRIPIETDDPRPGDEEPQGEEPSSPGLHAEAPEAPAAEPSEGEVEDPEERYLRLAAEFDNYKKRMERERNQVFAYANEGLLERLLTVVDNLERALAAAEPGGGQDGLVAGVELTLRGLVEVLRREGVEPIEAAGGAFDPTVHEAVSAQPSDDVPDGHIVHQLEKGYRYKERILRPAKVVVSSGSPS